MILLRSPQQNAHAIITDAKQVDDTLLLHDALRLLEQHYPGHIWSVTLEHGLMTIRGGAFRGQYGYVIHVNQWSADGIRKEIVRGAGEFLERHNVARGRRTDSTYDPHWFGHLKQAAP